MAILIDNALISGAAPISAKQIIFDNEQSGLEATTVQGAIDKQLLTPQKATPGEDYETYRIRNVCITDTIPTSMNDGDIALVYVKGI